MEFKHLESEFLSKLASLCEEYDVIFIGKSHSRVEILMSDRDIFCGYLNHSPVKVLNREAEQLEKDLDQMMLDSVQTKRLQ